jgi:hypothetical protein
MKVNNNLVCKNEDHREEDGFNNFFAFFASLSLYLSISLSPVLSSFSCGSRQPFLFSGSCTHKKKRIS